MPMACGGSRRRSRSCSAALLRPASNRPAGIAGLVLAENLRHHSGSVIASRGRSPSCSESQTWTAGVASSQHSRSSASTARTSRHIPRALALFSKSRACGQRRGVAKTKVVCVGSIPKGFLVRLLKSLHAFSEGLPPVPSSQTDGPLGSHAVPTRPPSMRASQPPRSVPSPARTDTRRAPGDAATRERMSFGKSQRGSCPGHESSIDASTSSGLRRRVGCIDST